MTRSKPISMKKLYLLLDEYLAKTYGKKNKNLQIEKVMHITHFLDYVWLHRND